MLKTLAKRAKHIRDDGGFGQLAGRAIRYLYNRSVRRVLPTTGWVRWNEVRFRPRKAFDETLPWSYPREKTEYEAALIAAMRSEVKLGDHVGIVGGGYGISAVVAASQVGSEGRVCVYEASAYRSLEIERTLSINDVADIVDVTHALVGPAVRVAGDAEGADRVAATELPEFDVLELDCEGAELDVLEGLEQRPRTIVVEVHAEFGSPEERVREELDRLGYEVVDRGVEREDWGVYVLTAHRRN